MTRNPPSIACRASGSTDRRALVTGAGRGIGLGAARRPCRDWARRSRWSRAPREDIEAAAADIRAKGGAADCPGPRRHRYRGDGGRDRRAEPYHILFNNAGLNRINAFLDVKVEDFDYVFGLNVRAAFFVAQAVARKLVAAKRDRARSSTSPRRWALSAPPIRSVYCASKWALEGMTRAMAIDLAPHGIRVNTICPTFIATPLANKFLADPEFQGVRQSKIKLGRVGEVHDLLGRDRTPRLRRLLADDRVVGGHRRRLDGGLMARHGRFPAANLHRPSFGSATDRVRAMPPSRPAVDDDRLIAYALAAEPVFAGMRALIGQLSGILILAQARRWREIPDLPDLAVVRERRDEVADYLGAASRRRRRGRRICSSSKKRWRMSTRRSPSSRRCAPRKTDEGVARASTHLKAAYRLMQSACDHRLGLAMVDPARACCSCGAKLAERQPRSREE